MTNRSALKTVFGLLLALGLAGCGDGIEIGPFKSRSGGDQATARAEDTPRRETIWDLLGEQPDPNVTVQVNKYIWNASLDVLDFLPIEAADPFSGIIVTGYGKPPGGGKAYRATVFVKDPALDARSLNVSLQTRSGTASAATTKAVEDAILNRARQLRIADGRL